jgi:D-glycero-alpha-D-manno-heptose 1-phosphate guanylyltransferase
MMGGDGDGLLPAAWILAGGLGTRLAGVLPELPKALAPVGGHPFLDLLLDRLVAAGFHRVVLLLGVRHQAILDFLGERTRRRAGRGDLRIDTSVEARPLGTAGALGHARALAHGDDAFFVLNGDTYVDFEPRGMVARHRASQAAVTMAAVEQPDCHRFGRLEVTSDGFLRRFEEKAASAGAGWVNAGVYLMQPEVLSDIPDDQPTSLESDVFPRLLSGARRIAVARQAGAFFDIGTPASLRALEEFMARTPAEIPAART